MKQGKMLKFGRFDISHEEHIEEELNKYLQEGYSVKSMTVASDAFLLVWLEKDI